MVSVVCGLRSGRGWSRSRQRPLQRCREPALPAGSGRDRRPRLHCVSRPAGPGIAPDSAHLIPADTVDHV